MFEDGDVRIKWSCGHEGYLNLDWLKRHCYSRHTLENRRKRSYPDLGKQVCSPSYPSASKTFPMIIIELCRQ